MTQEQQELNSVDDAISVEENGAPVKAFELPTHGGKTLGPDGESQRGSDRQLASQRLMEQTAPTKDIRNKDNYSPQNSIQPTRSNFGSSCRQSDDQISD